MRVTGDVNGEKHWYNQATKHKLIQPCYASNSAVSMGFSSFFQASAVWFSIGKIPVFVWRYFP